MGFLSNLFGGAPGPQQDSMDAGEFLRSLSPDQQQAFADKASHVMNTLVRAQEDNGREFVLNDNACLFIMRNTDTIGIVGNPVLFQQSAKTKGRNPLTASIFLRNLKSHAAFVRAPMDRAALMAIATEATLKLLSGHNEVCD